MGNIQIFNRNKDFQSVVPFPVDGSNGTTPPTNQPSKRKKSTSKTAPAPIDDTDVPNDTRQIDYQSTSQPPEILITNFQPLDKIDSFDFKQTESQLRRRGLADCEFECSQIMNHLFVGGHRVASNLELLKKHNITRIVNCATSVVENYFSSDPTMTYYSINMIDGRQDDIFWFLCEVVQFIIKGRTLGENTLIHCEKGVSRSCSFAIAYRMWSAGEKWQAAFNYVKEQRPVCAPNTAFTCNLIEIGEIFACELNTRNLIFRCAFHLPHDPLTAVLKLCRNTESRKIIPPSTSMLDPKGVFVLRSTEQSTNNQTVYVWIGTKASAVAAEKARALAGGLFGIVTNNEYVIEECEGEESDAFLSCLSADGPFSESIPISSPGSSKPQILTFDDLYDNKPSMESAMILQKEHELQRVNRDRPPPVVRESSIHGFEQFPEATGYFKKEFSSNNMDSASTDHSSSSAFSAGKVSRIPSFKFATNTAESVGSRRGSRGLAALERGPSFQRKDMVDLQVPVDTLDATNSTISSLRTDDHLDLSSSPFKMESFHHKMVTKLQDVQSNHNFNLATPSKITLQEMPEESDKSPDTGRSLQLPPVDPLEMTTAIDNNNGSKIEKVDEIQPTSGTNLAPSASKSEIGDKLVNSNSKANIQLSFQTPRKSKAGDKDTEERTAVSTEIPIKSPSVSRLLAFVTGGGGSSAAERPVSGRNQGPSMFRNSSKKVVPTLVDNDKTPAESSNDPDRKMSGVTDSTQTVSRLTSPASQHKTNDFDLTDSVNRADAGVKLNIELAPNSSTADVQSKIALPINNSATNLNVSESKSKLLLTQLPLAGARLPEDMEDLTTPVIRGKADDIMEPSPAYKPKTKFILKKHELYQVVVKESSRGVRRFEWQAMGVYDDDDLIETSILLLLCPNMHHFIWQGADFDFADTSLEDGGFTDHEFLSWLSKVSAGELHHTAVTGANLLSCDVEVAKAGEESEEFWTAFNDGY